MNNKVRAIVDDRLVDIDFDDLLEELQVGQGDPIYDKAVLYDLTKAIELKLVRSLAKMRYENDVPQ